MDDKPGKDDKAEIERIKNIEASRLLRIYSISGIIFSFILFLIQKDFVDLILLTGLGLFFLRISTRILNDPD